MPSLHLDVIAVGKLKEGYWTDACSEYLKRLSRYTKVTVTEVSDAGERSESTVDLVLRAQAGLLKQRISHDSYKMALDRAGTQLSSEELADLIVRLQNQGVSRLSFIIGGSWGLDASIKKDADLLLSLGLMTFPYNLARVVLLEQLYRCFSIINKAPYHK